MTDPLPPITRSTDPHWMAHDLRRWAHKRCNGSFISDEERDALLAFADQVAVLREKA